MDYRLQPTIEAVESTKTRDWKWGSYRNQLQVPGISIQIQSGGQSHTISIHDCTQRPEQDELIEAIRGIKRLDSNHTWIYETRRGVPGFSTTAWSTLSSQGSKRHAFMIHRSHDFRHFD
jgi:hypothetical protein